MENNVWSFSNYWLRQIWDRGYRLDQDGDKTNWANGGEFEPWNERQRGYESIEEMMEANGYTLADCDCWLRGVGEHLLCAKGFGQRGLQAARRPGFHRA